MSRDEPLDLTKIRRYSIRDRHSKVSTRDFGSPLERDSLSGFLRSLPDLLAGKDFRLLVDRIRAARDRRRSIIWGFGGHVVKVGLSPVLIDLMDRGFVTAMATNGSGMIHDFEIGYCGQTSEEVDSALGEGLFGMAEETGTMLNRAIQAGLGSDLGIGPAVGSFLEQTELDHPDLSLFLEAFRRKIDVSVHLAIGTDIIHCHPEASGAALGEGSYRDFLRFTRHVCGLDDGGVFLNLGSAVILPEVFLKAVSMLRGAGRRLEGFTTANFDFIQHYRPTQNVVRRPVMNSGEGVAITGHHEIMVPLLAAALIHCD